ncbi:DUF998 domain-containing protein [Streptomonospora sp. S1-112]|uniref:DUF998 domain-containing protein n=1 Tax=Streptomonospora mangrovi TaxID=2883123 RepID=A0A9X3NWM3_9ACTN|nr:DUF998 domain-containing protein [Streptomonospora mangrovi]MDA0565641.1 DUF998 domain-containing protein [Streptomonospora mangrovi]
MAPPPPREHPAGAARTGTAARRLPRPGGAAVAAGALLWLAQPLYLAAEAVTAGRFAAPYSFLDNAISDLGATSCTRVEYAHGPVPVCSPWSAVMNTAFIVLGLALAVGAPLLAARLPRDRAAKAAVALWILAGLSAIGSGVFPLDRAPAAHTVASLPVFVAQPCALITTGVALRRHRRLLGWSTIAVGAVCVAGTAVFAARVDVEHFSGLFERLALWPGHLWAAVLAVALLRWRPPAAAR